MKILVDLSVLEIPATGVARVVTGLYGAIAHGFPGIALHGVHRRMLTSNPPEGMRSDRIGRLFTPGLWRRYALPLAALRARGSFLHFPWNGGVPRLPRGVRVVTTMHDVLPLTIPGFFGDSERENRYRADRQADIDRTDLLVTDSEFSKREIERHFLLRREPVVVPCATSIADFLPGPGPEEKKYFLYVGGLTPRKSVDSLLRVFYRLSAGGTLHARLIVAGSTRHAPPALLALLDEGLRRGCVELPGYVDDRALAALYAGAIALVYPSPYEGFGLLPLEAMTIGCPVITCRATSIPEVCGDAALYVDPWSDQGLAEALMTFENDREIRERFSKAGLRRAAAYTWVRSAELFVQALQRCTPEAGDLTPNVVP